MPSCIVLVHDDPGFANPVLAALRAAGYDAVGFQNRCQPSTPWSIRNGSNY